MPNKHHLPVDLSRFGLENRNEIFVATDEPHGLIEATLVRDARSRWCMSVEWAMGRRMRKMAKWQGDGKWWMECAMPEIDDGRSKDRHLASRVTW